MIGNSEGTKKKYEINDNHKNKNNNQLTGGCNTVESGEHEEHDGEEHEIKIIQHVGGVSPDTEIQDPD